MNILITGGNGYIAKSLIAAFKDIYNITTLTRIDFDLTNKKAVSEWFRGKYFDVVIHTAIMGGSRLKVDDQSIIELNLAMYNNLILNQSRFNKLISFGSGAELFSPDTPYGTSKTIISKCILENEKCYNIRIFGLFDENELPSRFIKSNIIRYINKENMVIHLNKIMDFFYMHDLINLVEYYIKTNKPRKEINCSYNQKYTLLNIADIINDLGDYKVPIIINDNSKLDFYCSYNEDFPISVLGLKQGICITYNKLLSNLK